MEIKADPSGLSHSNENGFTDFSWGFSAQDGTLRFRRYTVALDCANPDSGGAQVTSSEQMPDGFVILAASGAITKTITGISNLDIGFDSNGDAFVNDSTTLTAGTTFTNSSTTLTAPHYCTGAENIIATNNSSGAFTDGQIVVTVFGFETIAPSTRLR